MNAPLHQEFSEGTEVVVQQPMTDLVSSAEINQQIATAKRYPRSITAFMHEARAMVTLNESIAQQCIYALPRAGKTIEGPSARFAEIVVHAWGNSRCGARIVNEGQDFITAEGVAQDLEKNVAITFQVPRRIKDSKGNRYNADMIGVTGNAASSIALRNAILKVVPKAFWEPLYAEARKVVAGDVKTLANKRAEAIKQFAIFGITQQQICTKLGRAGIADIAVDDLLVLFGILTAIKEGDTTPEEAFADETPINQTFTVKTKAQAAEAQQAATAEPPAPPPAPPADIPPAKEAPRDPAIIETRLSAEQTSGARVVVEPADMLGRGETAVPAEVETPPAPESASPSEFAYLSRKAKALSVSLPELASKFGLNMQKLTKAGFNTLKVELAKIERGE